MNEVEKQLAKLGESYSKDELERMKAELPRDYKTLSSLANRLVKEYAFLLDAAIVEGLAGNVPQAVLFHKLSYQALQMSGMIMEQARGEGAMEHYLNTR